MQTSTLLGIAILSCGLLGAVVLARPERAGDLSPPPRSAQAQTAEADPERDGEPSSGEVAEPDPADEPPKGRSLTRQDLELAMLKVRARALACRGEAPPPVVEVRLTISPQGQVTGVGFADEVRGTRAAECIAHALRAASFPPWNAPPVPSVEWHYPLRFDGE